MRFPLTLAVATVLCSTSLTVAAEVYETTRCADHGHPEFQFRVTDPAVPDVDIAWFGAYLEEAVARGERFKAGETLQVGWMLTKLEAGPNGRLAITEPDMKAIPIVFVDSVDSTLRHLRAQKDSVESVGRDVELVFPALDQSLVVRKNYESAREVVLERAEVEGSDSGWWLSDLADEAGNQDVANFKKVSVYELAVARPDLIKFLAFPPGYRIGVTREEIVAFKGNREVPFLEGSFLAEWNKTRR